MDEKIISLANAIYAQINDDLKTGNETKQEKVIVDRCIEVLIAMPKNDELTKRRQMILGKMAKLQEKLASK